MADKFDLKKFLKENKTIENSNPYFKKDINEGNLRERIKEMIIAELGNDPGMDSYDPDPDDVPDYETETAADILGTDDYIIDDPRLMESEPSEEEEYENALIDGGFASLEEAEEEETEETEEETEETEEEAPAEEGGDEEAPEGGEGGLEDIAADMEGTEGELMDHLMSALKVAKGMDNEKLTTQIGNTLKFFVSEYIGGEE